MPIPTTSQLLNPFLRYTNDGDVHTLKEVISHLAEEFELTETEFNDLQPSGRQTRFEKKVGWARYHLGKAGLLVSISKGVFKITPKGVRLLKSQPKITLPLI